MPRRVSATSAGVRTSAAIIVALGMASLAGCAAAGSPAASSAASTRITVASERCGKGWDDPRPGRQVFVLANTDIVTGEVFLVNASTNAVFAYVDDLAPGATATMRVSLGSGRYAFRCAMSDEGVARGSTVVLSGALTGHAPPVRAVTDNDLVPVAKAYDSWVTAALPSLQRLAGVLDDDIRSGDLARARADWLPAHLAYERLGAAYGAFGDADTAINGISTGLAGGVSDPGFTGFHRIEYGLWHHQAASVLAPFSRRLSSDIDALAATLAGSSVGTLDIAIRTHEIVEDALQFDLTGQSDFGSGTSLASVSAELGGTSELLGLMTPILTPRYPELHEAQAALEQAESDVTAFGTHGRWTPLTRLSRADRERVDADLGGLSSLLAPIASIAEPRITS